MKLQQEEIEPMKCKKNGQSIGGSTTSLILLIFFTLASVTSVAAADTKSDDGVGPSDEETTSEFFDTWIKDHLDIGLRLSTFALDDTGAQSPDNTYLGTINKVDDERDSFPLRPFVNIWFNKYIGLELTYDKIAGKTTTISGKSDGIVEMSGPMASIAFRYPNKTQFVPYAGVGVAFFSGNFDETNHWALGYNSPAAYDTAGRPSEPLGGRTRRMEVEDDEGFVLMAGVIWNISDSWAADVFIRKMQLDADATFIADVNGVEENRIEGSFPLDNIGFGLSVKYTF
jgi:outer membrane protein W